MLSKFSNVFTDTLQPLKDSNDKIVFRKKPVGRVHPYSKEARQELAMYERQLRICMIGWFKPESDTEMLALAASVDRLSESLNNRPGFDAEGKARCGNCYRRMLYNLTGVRP